MNFDLDRIRSRLGTKSQLSARGVGRSRRSASRLVASLFAPWMLMVAGCGSDRPALPGPVSSGPPLAPIEEATMGEEGDAVAKGTVAEEGQPADPEVGEDPVAEAPGEGVGQESSPDITGEGVPSGAMGEDSPVASDAPDTTAATDAVAASDEASDPDADAIAPGEQDDSDSTSGSVAVSNDSGPTDDDGAPDVGRAVADEIAEGESEGSSESDPDSVAVDDASPDSDADASADAERREMEEAAAAAIQEALSAAIAEAPPREPSVDHSTFDKILRAIVRGDRVDYDRLRADHASDLKAYLGQLAQVDDRGLDWEEERLAFYINLYNATMFQAVLDRSSASWTPAADSFAVFEDKVVRLMGREVSLNHLENEIVRKDFTEPRIHVALVCGARSCPQIRDRAYDPRTLDDMLNENMRAFLASGFRNRIDRRNRKLLLSQIFEWYAADFGGADQVAAFVDRYVSGDVSSYAVEFIEYEWDLNSTR